MLATSEPSAPDRIRESVWFADDDEPEPKGYGTYAYVVLRGSRQRDHENMATKLLCQLVLDRERYDREAESLSAVGLFVWRLGAGEVDESPSCAELVERYDRRFGNRLAACVGDQFKGPLLVLHHFAALYRHDERRPGVRDGVYVLDLAGTRTDWSADQLRRLYRKLVQGHLDLLEDLATAVIGGIRWFASGLQENFRYAWVPRTQLRCPN